MNQDCQPPVPPSEAQDAEDEFIHSLRKEAAELKDCFTRYSFQAMSIAVAALIAILRFQVEYAIVGVAYTLLSVCSMGTHKYATVNRLLGYELHLQRTRSLSKDRAYWRPHWRHIGWEEAMRAWRVVSTTIMDNLCNVPPKSKSGQAAWKRQIWKRLIWRFYPDDVRKSINVRDSCGKNFKVNIPSAGRWFEPSSLVPEGASYFAGGYLQTMLNGIYVIVFLSYVGLCTTPFVMFWKTPQSQQPNRMQIGLVVGLAVITGVFAFLRIVQVNARRRTLESGLLSIHSCAILWQAAVAAHFKAVASTAGDDASAPLAGYTHCLGREAVDYLPHLAHLNKVLNGAESPLNQLPEVF
jgi:hypothetical protein